MDILLDIIHTFDYSVLQFLFQHLRGTADGVWTAITSLGNFGILWIVLSIVLLCFRKTRRAGVAVLAALLLSLLIGNVLIKHWIMRPRPFVTHPDLIALVDPGDQWSFPSAHAMSSFAAATALCYFWRPAGYLAFLPAVLISFSRLVACVHYPTDVLAGCLLGILCGLFAGWLMDRIVDRIHSLRLRKGA